MQGRVPVYQHPVAVIALQLGAELLAVRDGGGAVQVDVVGRWGFGGGWRRHENRIGNMPGPVVNFAFAVLQAATGPGFKARAPLQSAGCIGSARCEEPVLRSRPKADMGLISESARF